MKYIVFDEDGAVPPISGPPVPPKGSDGTTHTHMRRLSDGSWDEVELHRHEHMGWHPWHEVAA